MVKPVYLTVHINNRERRNRKLIGRKLRDFAKKMSTHTMDGFAIVAFERGDGGHIRVWSSCSCRDAADRMLLPDIAKTQLLEKIILADDPPEPTKEGA